MEEEKPFPKKQIVQFCSICSCIGSLFGWCNVIHPFCGRHISKDGHAV